jgi:hypothetical protein
MDWDALLNNSTDPKIALQQLRASLRERLVPVHYRVDGGTVDLSMHGIIIPKQYIVESQEDQQWDMDLSHLGPSLWSSGTEQGYSPNANDYQAQALIYHQSFHTGEAPQLHLNQEFLFYFELRKQENGNFHRMSDDGEWELVVNFSSPCIKIRLKELCEFIAVKQCYYVLQFRRSALFQDRSAPLLKSSDEQHSTEDAVWRQEVIDVGGGNLPCLFQMGKIYRAPAPLEDYYSGKREKQFESFIIGHDDDGRDLLHTCDPDILSTYFEDRNAPHYLTPVRFRAEVIGKYLSDPTRYEIHSGYIQKRRWWSLRADTENYDHIVVFLGDLGRDLPTSEQQYWKSYNLASEAPLSDTTFRRSFLGEFASTQRPEFRLKAAIDEVNRLSKVWYGIELFLPLKSDETLWGGVALPPPSQRDLLDTVVGRLAKALVDSINSAEINSALECSLPSDKRSKKITVLRAFLRQIEFDGTALCEALAALQNLRSKSGAHRRGKDYDAMIAKIGGEQNLWSFAQANVAKTVDELKRLSQRLMPKISITVDDANL